MRPVRIFLFFLFLLLFFLLLSLVFPDNRIVIGKDAVIRFPGFRDLIREQKDPYADITPILKMAEKKDTVTRKASPDASSARTLSVLQEEVVQAIEYPGGDPAALSSFFQSLSTLHETDEGFHVFHFGDSQLEGDRITDYLRTRFQMEFGGSGPGLIPISDEQFRSGIHMETTGKWQRYSGLGVVDKSIPRGRFGPLGAVYRFTTFGQDTTGPGEAVTAGFTFTLAESAGQHTRNFSRFKLFYANAVKPGMVELKLNSQTVATDSFAAGAAPAAFTHAFSESPSSFSVQFTGSASPDLFGISLDSPDGISFDNIPLRGSSGLEFTRMNRAALPFILNSLNAKLLVLEFGVNVLPSPAEDYTYYQTGFYNQLMFLKGLRPDMSIIVISISDASVKNGTDYQSYPNVEKIVAAQRNAALKAGCAFWNLYEAMGGKNSMPGWVFANPPLATTDFIHFNYAGARIVGKMFYDALISDYTTYLRSR